MSVEEKNTRLMHTLDDAWKNGKIAEERLFYAIVGMMTQIGPMLSESQKRSANTV